MGKGDKKTRRGKITMKSYGVTRPRFKKKKTATVAPVIELPPVKAPAKEPRKPAVKKVAKPKKQAKAVKPAKKKE